MIFIKILPDWLTYLGAFGTLAALITAIGVILTIRRNRQKEKQEQKEKVRLDILNWAIDIGKFVLKNRQEAIQEGITSKVGTYQAFVELQRRDLFEIYEPFRLQSVYLEDTAKSILDNNTHIKVIRLITWLRGHINLLHKIRRGELKKSDESLAMLLGKSNDKMYRASANVIQAIGKAYTADIGN